MATYHVRRWDGRYLGEPLRMRPSVARYVRHACNALIFSRAGAIHQSQQLMLAGTAAVPVMLTASGTVKRVRVRSVGIR